MHLHRHDFDRDQPPAPPSEDASPAGGAQREGAARAAYRAIGLRVERDVGRIVAECKLPPEADAMLHKVVAELLGGADAMKAPAGGEAAHDGFIRVAAALDAYASHFAHPGWEPIAH